jgi:hypothetical protein
MHAGQRQQQLRGSIPLLGFSSNQGRVLEGVRVILVAINNLATSNPGKRPMAVLVLQAEVRKVSSHSLTIQISR